MIREHEEEQMRLPNFGDTEDNEKMLHVCQSVLRYVDEKIEWFERVKPGDPLILKYLEMGMEVRREREMLLKAWHRSLGIPDDPVQLAFFKKKLLEPVEGEEPFDWGLDEEQMKKFASTFSLPAAPEGCANPLEIL